METLRVFVSRSVSVAEASPPFQTTKLANTSPAAGSGEATSVAEKALFSANDTQYDTRIKLFSTTFLYQLMETLRAFVSRPVSVAGACPPFRTTKTANTSPTAGSREPTSGAEKTLFIETKYGLSIEFDHSLSVRSVMLTKPPVLPPHSSPSGSSQSSCEVVDSEAQPRTQTPEPGTSRYRYKLFPDWNTSCLWYDATWPQNPEDEYHVDFDEIERRYPALYPYFEAWEELYEVEFEKQGCHLGGTDPVFKDKAEGDAWLLEGFLMACWIALQEDVDQVEYHPGRVGYVIRRGNMEGLSERFLTEMPDRY